MTNRTVPAYLADRVRRTPPIGAGVVPGSTPVVAFGDPSRADVATLGINPSSREFLAPGGGLLTGDARRLETLDSLGARSLADLDDEHVASVVASCTDYFQRQPYKAWFDKLENIVSPALGRSYYDGSLCHLDLVQWATDPVWSGITDARVRDDLLEADAPFLREQLSQENIRLVILNGAQVVRQVRKLGLVTLEDVGWTSLGKGARRARLVRGQSEDVQFIGWTLNAQHSSTTSANRSAIADWLSSLREDLLGETPAGDEPAYVEPAAARHLAPTTVTGKAELLHVLKSWLVEGDAKTIGDVGVFGGRPLLTLDLGRSKIVINADTKRAAVRRFAATLETQGVERPWAVIANTKGVVNKVVFGGTEPIPGWYAYLVPAADRPTEV